MNETSTPHDDHTAVQQNAATRAYLDYYIDWHTPPKFAVLLTGKWGCGKSKFITDTLRDKFGEHAKSRDYMYISLYGMTSFADIESEFYRQLHPVLSSRTAKAVGTLLRGAVSFTLRFDPALTMGTETTLQGNIPDGSIFNGAGPDKQQLIVFDDLERCSIPLLDLLGYINQLVEQGDMRVILVADEDQLFNRTQPHDYSSENGPNAASTNTEKIGYQAIKEKLIGQTFKVMPLVGQAFDSFYNELPNHYGKTIVGDNRDEIKQIYRAAGLENLRLLRHALMEFCRFAESLHKVNPGLLTNKEIAKELVTEYLCYAMLVRSGEFHTDELSLFGVQGHFAQNAGLTTPKSAKASEWRTKLPWIDNYPPLLATEIWQPILTGGPWPLDDIKDALNNSRYLASQNTPNWVKLWHGTHELCDDNFANLLNAVMHDWDSKVYEHEGEVLHVLGTLLEFRKSGLHTRTAPELGRQARLYLQHLERQNKLDIPKSNDAIAWQVRDTYGQLQFFSLEDPNFKKILSFLDKQKRLAFRRSLPDKAAGLLELLRSKADTETFRNELSLDSSGSGTFRDTPILHLINPNEFSDAVADLHGEQMRDIAVMFKQRYQGNPYIKELTPELKWLTTVRKLLTATVSKRRGQNSSRLINVALLPRVDEAISALSREVELQQTSTKSHSKARTQDTTQTDDATDTDDLPA